MNLEIITKSDSLNIQNEIISQIKELINFKNLEPGDKLPSERMLAEKLGVSRGQIREAIQKLEFYGIEDILNLEEPDFKSLVETRILLELKTVRLAAIRRTEEDLKMMHDALQAYSLKVINGEDAVQEDLLFHLAIAKASGNSTMNTFMLIITPEIITNFEKHHVCNDVDKKIGIKEHQAVYDAIVAQDPQLAKMKMKEHFKELYQYCYNI